MGWIALLNPDADAYPEPDWLAALMSAARENPDHTNFDEDFFCYLEDVDLGFRLRLAGHRCPLRPWGSG